jgi:NAD(P)-dependent dehydrogenase (short-subunit alcohol dehydrogenase family)
MIFQKGPKHFWKRDLLFLKSSRVMVFLEMEMENIFCLKGKKGFVSGASRGLGREMALTLADAGADVALAARNVKELNETATIIKNKGRQGLVCPMDISKLEDIECAVREAVKIFGHIDILINNSGIAGEMPVLDMTPEKWNQVMDTNLKGHVFCTKTVGRHMIENRYGRIINIASIAGFMGTPYHSLYGMAKAGLILFTKTLALEWAKYNISVNAICPGYFLTDLNREFFQTPSGMGIIKRLPLRRLGKLDEIRGVTLLLASEASSFMTGSIIVLDGGQTI